MTGNKGAHIMFGNIDNICTLCNKEFGTTSRLQNHKCTYCKNCDKNFSSYQRLTTHKCVTSTETTSSTTEQLTCSLCCKQFSSEQLQNHKCTYCKNCDKNFSSYQRLTTHKCVTTTRTTSATTEQLTCSLCCKQFSSEQLQNHKCTYCKNCDKNFSSYQRLTTHKCVTTTETTSSTTEQLTCSLCCKQFSSEQIQNHKCTYCKNCDKNFSTYQRLTTHKCVTTTETTSSTTEQLTCSLCCKQFSPEQLQNHKCTYCKNCNKNFSSYQRLTTHKCVTTTETTSSTTEQLTCSLCCKQFSSEQIQNHKCTYCKNCDKNFSSYQRLTTHKCVTSTETTSSTTEQLTCSLCCKQFSSEQLQNHKCTYCKNCDKNFSSYQRLTTHKCVTTTETTSATTEQLTCSLCCKQFSSEQLQNHKCTYCKNCDKNFSSYQRLTKHKCVTSTETTSATTEQLTCSLCCKQFSFEQLQNHKCTYCKNCDKNFSSYQRLTTHKCVTTTRTTSATTEQLTCSLCCKQFSSEQLQNHKCNYCKNCDKNFSSYQRLTTHKCVTSTETTSSTLEQLTCSLCCKQFSSEQLQNHKCTYCKNCDKNFSSIVRLSSHTCVQSRNSVVANKESVNTKIINTITNSGMLISDEIIDMTLYRMSQQWPNVNIGLRLPSEVEAILSNSDYCVDTVPVHEHAVNIHFTTGHWVTTWQDPCDLKIKLYDSLHSKTRLTALLPTLKLFYDLNVYKVQYIRCVTQQSEVSCGAYAVAFAVSCAQHIPPDQIAFAPDEETRIHLALCLQQKNLEMFPVLPGQNPTPSLHSEGMIKVLKEINRQKEIKELHRQGIMKKETHDTTKATKRKVQLDSLDEVVHFRQSSLHKRQKISDHIPQSGHVQGTAYKDKEHYIVHDNESRNCSQKHRSQESADHRSNRLKIDRERKRKERLSQSFQQKKETQLKNKDTQRKKRLAENDFQRQWRQHKDTEAHNRKRMYETKSQKDFRRNKDKVHHKKLRFLENDIHKHNRKLKEKDIHSKLRLNETVSQKQQRRQKEKEKRRLLRLNETDSQIRSRKIKDKENHHTKRLNESDEQQQIRRKKEKGLHSKLRLSESDIQRQIRSKKDKDLHSKLRLNESDIQTQIRRKKDKDLHSKLRLSESDEQRQIRRKKDKYLHSKIRLSESDIQRQIRRKKEKDLHSKLRLNESDIQTQIRRKKDKDLHSKLRLSESDEQRQIRRKKDKYLHSKIRLSESDIQRQIRRKKEKDLHSKLRLNETDNQKRIRKNKDKDIHKTLRLNETELNRQIRRQKEKDCHSNFRKRQTISQKQLRQYKDKVLHRKLRSSETVQQYKSRLARDREDHRSHRNPSGLYKNLRQFWRTIKYSPEYICSVCHRTLYKGNILKLDINKYKKSEIVQKCTSYLLSETDKKWVCNTCHNHMIKGNIPPQAVTNKMEVSEDSSIMKELTDFEARLLAKRIPFMKVTALPRGRQKGIVGSVINVPADVDHTCEALPRTPTTAGIIPVKLKRKLEFKSHVIYQHVRPQLISEAFKWLKENNCHYRQVTDLSNEWEETSRQEDEELWNHLTQPSKDNDDQVPSDNETEERGNTNNEALMNEMIESSPDYPLDTCIQVTDPALDVSKAISFSPGEGKTPVGFMMDKGCEEMAFPKLFPTGQFGFDAFRQVSLSPKKYFNARILNRTGYFAQNIEYLFFAQYITEYKQVMDNISIALRKSYRQTDSCTITSSMIQDSERLSGLILQDQAYHFLQTVRGSPPYWQKALFKLLAAVKQFGIFTFFVTLSSADLKWYDTLQSISRQQGRTLTEEEIDNMSFEDKSALLRSNPVTAARHFDYRLHMFFKHFLLSKAEPLGKIKHYSYRIEFQQRGSPHAHIVLWTDGSPLPSDDDKLVCDFIDRYITAKIPDEIEDPEMHKLVTTVQQHHHSATCRKKGTLCRFNFPKLPSNETLIARKLEMDDPVELLKQKKHNLSVMTKVSEVLMKEDKHFTSVESVVEAAGITIEDYTRALKVTSRGSTVVLKRSPNEIHTNYYNMHLLRAWGANIDVQYCLDPYACITYMTAYITKDERQVSQILQAVSKECAHLDWKQRMKNCGKAFLNAREISAQEAVYRLLSFPLFKCSFRTIFVPADLPKNRVAILKPISLIQNMEQDDEDIFQKSIVDRYAARPESLSDLCLAYFAVWYVPIYKKHSSINNMETETDFLQNGRAEKNSSDIMLSGGCGLMKKSSTPAVLRYHRKSVQKTPSEYYYSQLLLYIPWMDEEELLHLHSYEQYYNTHKDIIDTNKEAFEHYTEIIENTLDEFEENGPPLHGFEDIAAQTQQEQDEMEAEGIEIDEDTATLEPPDELLDNNNNGRTAVTSRSVTYSIEMRPGVMTDQDYYSLVRSLNDKQRDVYHYLSNWCSNNSRGISQQICLFVSGGAGTGKSHLISALYQMATRTLQRVGDNPDDVRVLLAAPTGTAAHNISGVTLHSAFLLQLGQAKSYVKLSDDKRNGLRSKAGNLSLLIVDEISMVSSDLLLQIHNRLCEVKGVNEAFGGVSVVAFGDLYQLPPVLQPFVFKPVNDVFANFSGSLWREFDYKELDEIMRQKEDLAFANMLNRVRTASCTEEDITFLKSRHIESQGHGYPRDCLHVFATNKAVDEHNDTMLESLKTEKFSIVATDKKPAALASYDVNSDSRFTGGLPSVIRLSVGAKVMLIRNIDVGDGLVNGAQGTVIALNGTNNNISVVFVNFNSNKVGAKARENSRHVTEKRKFPNATPIEKSEISFTINKKNKGLTITRCQFPLKLAWGCTIHKVQGLTVPQIVVSFRNRFNDGQAYVALSRVKSGDGLYILDFDEKKIRANKSVLDEMDFLHKERQLPSSLSYYCGDSETSLIVSELNVRSLPLHSSDVLKDPIFAKSHVVVLCETWLSSNIPTEEVLPLNNYQVHRANGPLSTAGCRRAGGVLIAVKQPYVTTQLYSCTKQTCQLLLLKITRPKDCELYVIGLYIPPRKETTDIFKHFQSMLKYVTNRPCVIVGDFNENALETPKTLQKMLNDQGFQQRVNQITHSEGSCLDHIYTRHIDSVTTSVPSTYYSDHRWTSCKFQI